MKLAIRTRRDEYRVFFAEKREKHKDPSGVTTERVVEIYPQKAVRITDDTPSEGLWLDMLPMTAGVAMEITSLLSGATTSKDSSAHSQAAAAVVARAAVDSKLISEADQAKLMVVAAAALATIINPLVSAAKGSGKKANTAKDYERLAELVMSFLTGWGGFTDEDGNVAPYSEDIATVALNNDLGFLFMAYRASTLVNTEANRKVKQQKADEGNSPSSSGTNSGGPQSGTSVALDEVTPATKPRTARTARPRKGRKK